MITQLSRSSVFVNFTGQWWTGREVRPPPDGRRNRYWLEAARPYGGARPFSLRKINRQRYASTSPTFGRITRAG